MRSILSLLTILSFLLAPTTIQAQEATLSVSPPLSVRAANLGTTLSIPLRLQNESGTPQTITPSIRIFTADGVSGRPVIDFATRVDLAILRPEPLAFETPFVLGAGQTQELAVEITPPSPLRSDLQYVVLFASSPQGLAGSGATTTAMIGSSIIIQADQMYVTTGGISIGSIALPRVVDMFSTLSPRITVTNDSQTLRTLSGVITLRGMFGDTKAVAALFSDTVLGQSTRILRASHKQEALNIPTDITFPGPFLPGKYALDITVTSASDSAQTARIFIYVLPLRLVAALGAIGTVVWILLRYSRGNSRT